MAISKLKEASVTSKGRISARVPLSVQEHLQEAADLAGATINQFIVQAAMEAAERVISRERLIKLSHVESKRFCDLLDNPPQPNLALHSAFKRYSARKEHSGDSDSTFEFSDIQSK